MRLVRFSNDMYGIRMGWWFGWKFLDLTNFTHSWTTNSCYFKDCQGFFNDVKAIYDQMKLSYKIIE